MAAHLCPEKDGYRRTRSATIGPASASISVLVALSWLAACTDLPQSPSSELDTPGAQAVVVQGGNIFAVTVTIDPDTFPAGPAGADTALITVQIDSIASFCVACTLDSVEVSFWAYHQPEGTTDSIPISYRNFQYAQSPNTIAAFLTGDTPADTFGVAFYSDANGRVYLPYVTNGAPGTEWIVVFLADPRFELANDDDVLAPIAVSSDSCPPDPWFTDPDVFDSLRDIWNMTNTDLDVSQRQEQGVWIVENNGDYSTIPVDVVNADPCSIESVIVPPAGAVARGHTHPIREGETIPPGACAQFPNGAKGDKSGVSENDISALGTANDTGKQAGRITDDMVGLVIESDGLFRYTVKKNAAGEAVIDGLDEFDTCGIVN